jgi:heme O synthase-like polyprenyltransferase
MVRLRTGRRPTWAELLGSYGLWAFALVLGVLGIFGLGQ